MMTTACTAAAGGCTDAAGCATTAVGCVMACVPSMVLQCASYTEYRTSCNIELLSRSCFAGLLRIICAPLAAPLDHDVIGTVSGGMFADRGSAAASANDGAQVADIGSPRFML